MIFYQAPGSPTLYPTQAAAGKGFIQHDIPVDKAGLMAYVNALQASEPAPPEVEEPEPVVEASSDCRMCHRSPIAAAHLNELLTRIEVLAWVERVQNPRVLELVATTIQEKLK